MQKGTPAEQTSQTKHGLQIHFFLFFYDYRFYNYSVLCSFSLSLSDAAAAQFTLVEQLIIFTLGGVAPQRQPGNAGEPIGSKVTVHPEANQGLVVEQVQVWAGV